MPESFDAYQYFSHLRSRWRLPALMLGAAVVVALGISLLLPKAYTARVTLVIEQPPGVDPRSVTAVSPMYVESLRTYEHFAASDHLFSQAVERFQLREGRSGATVEGLKRRILEVSVPRNTKVLEVAVTLPEPRKAHAVALFVAEETIRLARNASRSGDEERIAEIRKQAEQANERLAAARAAQNRAEKRGLAPEALRAELEQLRALQEEIERMRLSAELAAQPSAAGRAAELRERAAAIDRQIESREALLVARTSELEAAITESESAWQAREDLARRLRELEATAGFRGERLSLLDPGVPPERPSAPNLPLNVVVAFGLALIASFLYLTGEFVLQDARAENLRKNLRVAAKS
jgi:uncharacterized protein involved in exopolysaccharide biosynthesis